MGTLSIPKALRDTMLCITCTNYLSYFPINVKNDGSGAICGRCQVTEKDSFSRDEAYESIAQFIVFPCRHNATGCKEELTPYYLEEHERLCLHRKSPCPSNKYTKCAWEGSDGDLVNHFSEIHPDLLMKEAKFELNFVNSSKGNALLSSGKDLFVVEKEVDARLKTFLCTVQHLRSVENTENYNYILQILNADMTFSHKFPEKSTMNEDNPTRVTASFVRENLRDPASAIVIIEIVKASRVKKEEAKQTVVVQDPNINWKLLGELECPICSDFMLPPIFQCLNGHSICAGCKLKTSKNNTNECKCALCSANIQETRNFSLEKTVQFLTYPCKFYTSGCPYSCMSTEIEKHHNACKYGPYECPLKETKNCQLDIKKTDMISHVENNHNDSLLKSEIVTVPFRKNENKEYCYLIVFSVNVFKLVYKYENEKFYWVVQIVGPQEEHKDFKFEIEVTDMKDGNQGCTFRRPCSLFSKNIDSFNNIGLEFFLDDDSGNAVAVNDTVIFYDFNLMEWTADICFQQDGATSHTTRENVTLLRTK